MSIRRYVVTYLCPLPACRQPDTVVECYAQSATELMRTSQGRCPDHNVPLIVGRVREMPVQIGRTA